MPHQNKNKSLSSDEIVAKLLEIMAAATPMPVDEVSEYFKSEIYSGFLRRLVTDTIYISSPMLDGPNCGLANFSERGVSDSKIVYTVGPDADDGKPVYQSWSHYPPHYDILADRPTLLLASDDPVQLVRDTKIWQDKFLAESPKYSFWKQGISDDQNVFIECRNASEAVHCLDSCHREFDGELSPQIIDNHNGTVVAKRAWEYGCVFYTDELKRVAISEGVQSPGEQLVNELLSLDSNGNVESACKQADDLVRKFASDSGAEFIELQQIVRLHIQSECDDEHLKTAILKFERDRADKQKSGQSQTQDLPISTDVRGYASSITSAHQYAIYYQHPTEPAQTCQTAAEAVRAFAMLPPTLHHGPFIRDNNTGRIIAEPNWKEDVWGWRCCFDGYSFHTAELRESALAEKIQTPGEQFRQSILDICRKNQKNDLARRQADDLLQKFAPVSTADSAELRKAVHNLVQNKGCATCLDSAIRKFERAALSKANEPKRSQFQSQHRGIRV